MPPRFSHRAAALLCLLLLASPAGAATKPARAKRSPEALRYKIEVTGQFSAARADLARILKVEGRRTLANTLDPYNDLLIQLDLLGNKAGLMQEGHPDSAVRNYARTVSQEFSSFVATISTDPRMYEALKAVPILGEDEATQFFVFKQLRDFRRSGVDRDSTTRARLRELNDLATKFSLAFEQNISEDKSVLLVDPGALEGLPADYVQAHKPADGKVKLTMAYPDYVPFLTYSKSDAARRDYQKLFQNRAYPANDGVFDTLLQTRYDYATLLGYKNWADYVTEDKMIGSGTRVAEFIDRIAQASDKQMHANIAELVVRKRKDDSAATSINYWESAYYQELVKKESYSFSAQEVRPYFPFERVKQGLFSVTGKLFGVSYRRVRGARVWHPSVECYDIYQGKEKLGRFYLDLFPRPNKFSHAACFGIRNGIKGRQLPEEALLCNFPQPKKGDPALMEHDDVETFFHEFGHLLHGMFAGKRRWMGNAGISTEQDFVEAPSQMLEEWVWDAPTLQTFAHHYQTGKPIPDELVARMRRARDFGKGIQVRQQMFYAGVSLFCHNRDPRGVNTTAIVEEAQAKYSPWKYVEGTHMQDSFGHLTNYSAVYYTYMWSLVIAKDMFSAFQGHPLLSPEVATRYRTLVLEPGGSKPAAKLVEDFLGRPYGFKSYEDWLNAGN